MIKTYLLNGMKFRFEEGTQPNGATLIEKPVAKVKMVIPETKVIEPETKVEKPKTKTVTPKKKSTKKG